MCHQSSSRLGGQALGTWTHTGLSRRCRRGGSWSCQLCSPCPPATGSAGLDPSSHLTVGCGSQCRPCLRVGGPDRADLRLRGPQRVWSPGVERGSRPRPRPAVGPALWPLGGAAVLRVCRDGPGPRAEAGWGRSFRKTALPAAGLADPGGLGSPHTQREAVPPRRSTVQRAGRRRVLDAVRGRVLWLGPCCDLLLGVQRWSRRTCLGPRGLGCASLPAAEPEGREGVCPGRRFTKHRLLLGDRGLGARASRRPTVGPPTRSDGLSLAGAPATQAKALASERGTAEMLADTGSEEPTQRAARQSGVAFCCSVSFP